MSTELPFGPWLPDQTDHKNPGLEVCTNVIPGPGGYGPARGPNDAVASVAGRVLSAQSYERASGQRVTVCATASDLHVIVGNTATASGLTLALTGPVRFQRFGARIYATSGAGTWYLDNIEASTVFLAAGWTIPAGRAIARIGDFLMMGNLVDTDTNEAPYRIRWSPFNNPAGAWETNVGTQSDAIDMPADLGPVMGITGGASGLVFQRRGVSQIIPTGGVSVFAKREIDRERGLEAPGSLAQVGERVYYMADDGFFVTDGTSGQSISRDRIWRWWLDNAAQMHLDTVQAAVDWPNRCVVWTVPDETGRPYALLYFNWETSNWSVVEIDPECVFSSGVDGLTLEQVSALYPDLDAMPLSLDAPEFNPRGRVLTGFFGGEMRHLTGNTLRAEFGTGEFQAIPGRRSFVRDVTPIITDADASALVTLRGRDDQRSTYRQQANVALGSLGYAPTSFDARYFRVNIAVPGGANWSDAYGFQMNARASGRG